MIPCHTMEGATADAPGGSRCRGEMHVRNVRETPACAWVRLGTLEAEIMGILWDEEDLSPREIIARIPTEPACTTVTTVLGNLVRKGLIAGRKDGRFTRYSPIMEREDYVACVMARRMLLSRDRAKALRFFTEFLTDEDLDALQEVLDERRVSA